jgi:hypothetical protein
VRAFVSLAAAGAALMLSACDYASANSPTAAVPRSPGPRPTVPAAEAGGACRLLDYDVIGRTLGVRFDVAAAGRQARTDTCLARSSGADLPDLVLTVSPTTAGAAVFRAEMAPDGAEAVKALGTAAYRNTAGAGRGHGPVAEVGWLSGDRRLLTLRYTTPPGESAASAKRVSVRLVALARTIDFVRS